MAAHIESLDESGEPRCDHPNLAISVIAGHD